jgi:hypothetical protein
MRSRERLNIALLNLDNTCSQQGRLTELGRIFYWKLGMVKATKLIHSSDLSSYYWLDLSRMTISRLLNKDAQDSTKDVATRRHPTTWWLPLKLGLPPKNWRYQLRLCLLEFNIILAFILPQYLLRDTCWTICGSLFKVEIQEQCRCPTVSQTCLRAKAVMSVTTGEFFFFRSRVYTPARFESPCN